MQDRGSGRRLPSGQGTQSTETRGCPQCGKGAMDCLYKSVAYYWLSGVIDDLYQKAHSAMRHCMLYLELFLPLQDHYMLIFNALLVYLESFDTYANFQNI